MVNVSIERPPTQLVHSVTHYFGHITTQTLLLPHRNAWWPPKTAQEVVLVIIAHELTKYRLIGGGVV